MRISCDPSLHGLFMSVANLAGQRGLDSIESHFVPVSCLKVKINMKSKTTMFTFLIHFLSYSAEYIFLRRSFLYQNIALNLL